MNYFKHSNFCETDSCKTWYLVYRLAASGLNQVVKSTMSHLDMTIAVAVVICSTSHVLQTWKQDLIFWVWLLMFNLVSHSIHSMYMAAVNLYTHWTKNDDYKKWLAWTSVSVMANLPSACVRECHFHLQTESGTLTESHTVLKITGDMCQLLSQSKVLLIRINVHWAQSAFVFLPQSRYNWLLLLSL